jgi:hypothetical protein
MPNREEGMQSQPKTNDLCQASKNIRTQDMQQEGVLHREQCAASLTHAQLAMWPTVLMH